MAQTRAFIAGWLTMKNKDRVRGLNDKRLAQLLVPCNFDCQYCLARDICNHDKSKFCWEYILEWLNLESEG